MTVAVDATTWTGDLAERLTDLRPVHRLVDPKAFVVDPREFDGRTLLFNVPVTVIVVALVCWVLAANGIRFDEVFERRLLNPFVYFANMFFHTDWGHFVDNVRLWIPFGVALTWLTSNRHVLGIALTAQVLVTVVSMAIFRYGIGLSVVVLAVAGATLVRASGIAMRNQSTETIGATLVTVLGPLVLGFLLVTLLAGGATTVGHLEHFLGFCFGAALEAMYVFSEYGSDAEAETETDRGRSIPEQFR